DAKVTRRHFNTRLHRRDLAFELLARESAQRDLRRQALLNVDQVLFRQRDVHVNRVQLLQRYYRVARIQVLADIDLANTELAVKRCSNGFLLHLLTLRHGGGLGLLTLAALAIQFRLGNGTRPTQTFVALELELRKFCRRLQRFQLRRIGAGIQRHQQIARFHPVATLEVDLVDGTSDLRGYLNAVDGAHRADGIE